MSLLTRLVDPQPGEEKIAVHQFLAAIAEFTRGAPGVTVQRFVEEFNLNAAEEAQLVAWYTTEVATGNLTRERIHDVLLLGEVGIYSVSQVMSRLNL